MPSRPPQRDKDPTGIIFRLIWVARRMPCPPPVTALTRVVGGEGAHIGDDFAEGGLLARHPEREGLSPCMSLRPKTAPAETAVIGGDNRCGGAGHVGEAGQGGRKGACPRGNRNHNGKLGEHSRCFHGGRVMEAAMMMSISFNI